MALGGPSAAQGGLQEGQEISASLRMASDMPPRRHKTAARGLRVPLESPPGPPGGQHPSNTGRKS
eukprot:3714380-Pyramimonas_sp.AAC.1